jgi:predicted Zn-dependent protease
MRGYTPLMRLLVSDFVARYHVSYDDALDAIYRSETFKNLIDKNTTLATWAPQDLLDLYERTEMPFVKSTQEAE